MDKTESMPVDLKQRLEIPLAVLILLRDTRLFNPMLDRAIKDIECLLNEGPEQ